MTHAQAKADRFREQLAAVADDEANLLPNMRAIGAAVVEATKWLPEVLADLEKAR